MTRITGSGPLSHSAYRKAFAARAISCAGTSMQIVAASWYVYKLTGNASSVGILAALAMGPSMIGAPLGGSLLDRFELRRLSIVLNLCQALPYALMAAIAITGDLSIGWIYALVVAAAVPGSLNQPVSAIILPQTVPVQLRQSAIALSSMIYNVSRLLGAAVGGVVVQWTGVAAAFSFNAASFVVMAATVAVIPLAQETSRPAPRHAVSFPAALRQGWNLPQVRAAAVAVGLFFVLVAPVEQLMPVIAEEHGMTPSSVGLLVGAIAVGALIANTYITRFRPDDTRRRQLMVLGLLLAAVGLVILAVTPRSGILIDLIGTLLIGLAWEAEFVSGQATVIAVPPEIRGRLMGVFFLMLTATTAGGAVTLGMLHDLIGMPQTLLCVAALAATAAGFLTLRTGSPVGNATPPSRLNEFAPDTPEWEKLLTPRTLTKQPA